MSRRDESLVVTSDSEVSTPAVIVSKRGEFLSALSEAQRYKSELTEELDCSRSTVDRAIRSLEDCDLVTRREDGYETTIYGRLAVARYQQFLAEQEAVLDAREILAQFPKQPELPIESCLDGEMHSFCSPFQLFEDLTTRLRETDRYRAVFPKNVGARQLRLCHSLAVDRDADVELLLERDRFRQLAHEYHGLCATLVDEAALWVVAEHPPVAVLLSSTEGEPTEDATVQVIGYADNDEFGVIHSGADTVLNWARSYYERRRAESTSAREFVDDVDLIGRGPLFGGEELPLSLSSQGFIRIDDPSTELNDPLSTTTASCDSLDLAEVHAGDVLPPNGSDETEHSLADHLTERLQTDSPIAVLGPPGSGKSSVCKRVADEWCTRIGGIVLYRESGRGEQFDSPATLQRVIEREDRPVLVVVEDAIRAEAHDVFRVLEQTQGADDVAFLFDGREREWTDPAEFPIDARQEALRQDAVDIVRVPRIDH